MKKLTSSSTFKKLRLWHPVSSCMHAKSLQLCPTLWDPMDCSPPGSFVHGILQARILAWVAMPSSRDLPDPGIKLTSLMSPALAGGFFTTSATQEAITSWCIKGEKVKAAKDFIFLGSKITADGDCSHEIKRCLLLGRKAITNQIAY